MDEKQNTDTQPGKIYQSDNPEKEVNTPVQPQPRKHKVVNTVLLLSLGILVLGYFMTMDSDQGLALGFLIIGLPSLIFTVLILVAIANTIDNGITNYKRSKSALNESDEKPKLKPDFSSREGKQVKWLLIVWAIALLLGGIYGLIVAAA